MKKALTLLVAGFLCISMFLLLLSNAKADGTYTDFESGFGGWQPSILLGSMVQLSTAYSHSATHSVEQLSISTGNQANNSEASMIFPISHVSTQYELSVWVYVTNRTDGTARSFFGFTFSDGIMGWDVWGSSGSYLWEHPFARSSIPHGLTLNTWHKVNITAYVASGNVSIWVDDIQIVVNQRAFVSGEHPTNYFLECWANYNAQAVIQHFVDDVYIRETMVLPMQASISPLSTSINVGDSVTFASTAGGGTQPYSYQWYLDGNPVSGATSSSWAITPTTSGIYYVYLKVIDSANNTAQSETARITVTSTPVGGYSFPIEGHTLAKPLTPYLTLIALIVGFVVIRRKTGHMKVQN